MARLTPDEVRAWAEETCRVQQLPLFVTDPDVVDRVRTLLTGAAARSRQAERGGAPADLSQPPLRVDAAAIDVPDSGGGGVDHDVAQDRSQDGPAPVEVEPGPLTT